MYYCKKKAIYQLLLFFCLYREPSLVKKVMKSIVFNAPNVSQVALY